MPSVLVTGASTGIGRASALEMDRLGWRVFAGVRRSEDAESIAEDGGGRIEPVMLDVTDEESIAAAGSRVSEATGSEGLRGLVNNAGVAIPGPLETLPLADFRRQIDVNLTGQVAVTQAMLPLIRRARGRIVFVSSVGGRVAFPFTGAYHASKFGIEAVGDVLRQELRRWGIAVSVVEPGSVATPIWERGEATAGEIADRAGSSQEELYGEQIEAYRGTLQNVTSRAIAPERVAEAIRDALTARRPRTRYPVGRDAAIQVRLRPLLGDRLFDRIIGRAIKT